MKKNMFFSIVLSVGLLLPVARLDAEFMQDFQNKFAREIGSYLGKMLSEYIPKLNMGDWTAQLMSNLREKQNQLLYGALGLFGLSSLVGGFYAWNKKRNSANIPKKSMPDQEMVFVQTSDGEIKSVSRWQVDEMSVLHDLLIADMDSARRNNPYTSYFTSQENPLRMNELMINSQTLSVVCDALDAISKRDFKSYYENFKTLQKSGKYDQELSAYAEKIGAFGVMAFCFDDKSASTNLGISKQSITSYLIKRFISIAAFPKKIQILDGHPKAITAAAISPDGKNLVSGCNNNGKGNDLIFWGRQESQFKVLQKDGLGKGVTALAFDPSKKGIAVGYLGVNREVVLWDIETFSSKSLIEGRSDIRVINFEPLNTFIAIGLSSNDNNLVIWERHTKEKRILNHHKASITAITFDKTGKYMLSSDEKGIVAVWETETWALRSTKTFEVGRGLSGLGSTGCMAKISPDGMSAAIGIWKYYDNVILYNEANKKSKILNGHPKGVNVVAFSPDGKYVASGCDGEKNNLLIWDTQSGELLWSVEGAPNTVNVIDISSDGKMLLIGGYGDSKTYANNLVLFSLLPTKEREALEGCNAEQAEFLYEMALVLARGNKVVIEPEYSGKVFETLPSIVQRLLRRKFGGEIPSEDDF